MEENQTTVDLSGLTADQLIALSEKDWDNLVTVVKAAIAAKKAEEKAKLKEKLAKVVSAWNTYIVPVIKYGAGAIILLKLFGKI